jgi:tetratricopeptide (TPR) repeat protein
MKKNLLGVIITVLLSIGIGFIIGRASTPLNTAFRRASRMSAGSLEDRKDALELMEKQRYAIDLALEKTRVEERRLIIAIALGKALTEHEMWNEAIKYLETAREILPGDYTANYYLGVSYSSLYNLETSLVEKAKLYDKAMGYIDTALKLRPDSADANYLKGILLFNNGESVTALEYFENILKRYPDDVEALLSVARIYFDWGELDQARNIYLRLENLIPPEHPKAATVRRNLEILHRTKGYE